MRFRRFVARKSFRNPARFRRCRCGKVASRHRRRSRMGENQSLAAENKLLRLTLIIK